MHQIDLIRKRLRLAGWHCRVEWPAGIGWAVELTGPCDLPPVTGQTQTVAWERALRTVEALGVVVPLIEEDAHP